MAIWLIAICLGLILTAGIPAVGVYTSNPELAIPDGNPMGTTDTLVVPSGGPIQDLDVSIDISHTWVGDLEIVLEHVDTGTTVTLVDRPGLPAQDSSWGCSGDDMVITLDDEATLSVHDDCVSGGPAYITGEHYSPESPLSAFDGENIGGTWLLTLIDHWGEDPGTLHSWSLSAEAPLLAVFKEASPEAVTPGQTLTFTLAALNASSEALADVVVTDTLASPDLTFVSASSPSVEFDAASSTLTWTLGTLSSQEAASCEITVTANTADLITNTAWVTATSASPASATVFVNTVDLAVAQSVSPETAGPGDTVEFAVVIENRGSTVALSSVFTDVIPPQLSYVSDTIGGVFDPVTDTLTANLASMTSGSAISFEIVAEVISAELTTNTVQVSNAQDLNAANNQSSVTFNRPVDLFVEIMPLTTSMPVSGTVAYAILAGNDSADLATGVEVTLSLPDNVEYVSDDIGGDLADGVWEIGTLLPGPPGETCTFIGRLTSPGTIETGAMITGDQGDLNVADNTYSLVHNVTDLQINKSADLALAPVGSTPTYTLTVVNASPFDAYNVVVTDPLPPQVAYLGDDQGVGAPVEGVFTWEVGTLGAFSSAVCNVTVQVTIPTNLLTNTASVTSDQGDVLLSNNTAMVVINDADLAITKTPSATGVGIGEIFSYEIEVTDLGPSGVLDGVVTDVLPSNVRYIDSTRGSYDLATSTWTWDLPPLPSGSAVSATVSVELVSPGEFTNTAIVSSELDITLGNNAAMATVNSPTDLSIVKTADDDLVNEGDTFTYLLTVTNDGPTDAGDVVVEDSLPANVSWVSDSAGAGPPVDGNLTWQVGSLSVGQVATCEITVEAIAPGLITNTATVSAICDELDDADNTSSVTTNDLDLAVSTRASASHVDVGDTFTYILEAWNPNGEGATGVVVADNLPSRVTYVSASNPSVEHTGGVVTWTIGDLSAGERAACEVTVEVTELGSLTNTATVAAFQGDSATDNSTDSITTGTYEIGSIDFRISNAGPLGDPDFSAHDASVAHNETDDQWLVVWSGEDNVGIQPSGELEVYGRLLDSDGSALGPDFRISAMGLDIIPMFGAYDPVAVWNSTDNEYLVVWSGNHFDVSIPLFPPAAGLNRTIPEAMGELEIWGQRLDSNGAEIGVNDFRISDMGIEGGTGFGAVEPSAVWNAEANEYLVVWSGNEVTGDPTSIEQEIWGQRLDASGIEVGPNDFRISTMGPDGSITQIADSPSVTLNPASNEYLVVWSGDDATGSLVDGEFEIWGQRLDATGAEIGADDFRISTMGPDGDPFFSAQNPSIAHSETQGTFLVVWEGADDVDGRGIFAQQLASDGSLIGDSALVSASGFGGDSPAVSWNSAGDEYLVTWSGHIPVPGGLDSISPLNPLGGNPLWDNGPLVNAPGAAAGGADASVLQTHLGMNIYGYSNQLPLNNRVADEFTIPAGTAWNIERIVVYGYQTGSTTTSPITAVNMQIWDGRPGDIGSSVVFGDTATNHLIDTRWSGVYRVVDYNMDATDRPQFVDTLDVQVSLPAGTYWLDWTTGGSGPYTGPWIAPITITGVTTTGNARIFQGFWDDLLDSGIGSPQQGLPFLIIGAPSETEILAQRIDAATGAEIGDDDFRVSRLGPNRDLDFGAHAPAVAINSESNEALVVWHGNDTRWGVADDEIEVYGQRLLLGAEIEIVPDTLDVGPWYVEAGLSAPATVTVFNRGGVALEFVAPALTLTGPQASEFVASAELTAVAAGASREINVMFDPTVLHERTATLTIATDDLNQPEVTCELSGEGVIATQTLVDLLTGVHAPLPLEACDVNGDGSLDAADVVTNVNASTGP